MFLWVYRFLCGGGRSEAQDDSTQSLQDKAAQLKADKEFLACGHAYQVISNVAKEERKVALYNSGLCFEKAGRPKLATRQYQRFIRAKGKSGGLDRVLIVLTN